jgi:hypothetical protein
MYTTACILAGENQKTLEIFRQWQQSDAGILFVGEVYLKPFDYFEKNHPLLDPIRNEPGFEELWDGNILKLKKLKLPKRT